MIIKITINGIDNLCVNRSIFFLQFGQLIEGLFGSAIMDFMYLREWKPRHTIVLIVLRPITLIIFLLFVPLKPFPLLGGLIPFVLFFMFIGILFWYARQFSLVMSKYFKNTASTYGLIFFPVILIMLYLFFRIL